MSLVRGVCVICERTRPVILTGWVGSRLGGVCRDCAGTDAGRVELARGGVTR